MKRSRDEFLKLISDYIGDDNSDIAIQLLEDAGDSILEEAGEDWKQKYEDNDREWRERYKARFVNGNIQEKEEMEDLVTEPLVADDPDIDVDELFDDVFENEESEVM